MPAERWQSDLYARSPTGLAPTAKPNGSSKPCCANGHTPAATAPATNAISPSHPGSTTTTIDDHTAPSATEHPSPGSPPPDERSWELQLARVERSAWSAKIEPARQPSESVTVARIRRVAG